VAETSEGKGEGEGVGKWLRGKQYKGRKQSDLLISDLAWLDWTCLLRSRAKTRQRQGKARATISPSPLAFVHSHP
jgi:hypothetical protein